MSFLCVCVSVRVCPSVCVCVRRAHQVAMTRSCVCVRSVMVGGKRHRRLVKVKDMTTDDVTVQEAAYQDISGE